MSVLISQATNGPASIVFVLVQVHGKTSSSSACPCHPDLTYRTKVPSQLESRHRLSPFHHDKEHGTVTEVWQNH